MSRAIDEFVRDVLLELWYREAAVDPDRAEDDEGEPLPLPYRRSLKLLEKFVRWYLSHYRERGDLRIGDLAEELGYSGVRQFRRHWQRVPLSSPQQYLRWAHAASGMWAVWENDTDDAVAAVGLEEGESGRNMLTRRLTRALGYGQGINAVRHEGKLWPEEVAEILLARA